MIKDLIKIANILDSKGLSREANDLDAIINKISGLGDEPLTDESTEMLREEDASGVMMADHALRYAPDEEFDDPDSYINSIDLDMDLLTDTNIMPSQVVGDEDLLTTHDGLFESTLESLPESLAEGIMTITEGLLETMDSNEDNSLSKEEISMAIYDLLSNAISRENSDIEEDELVEKIKKEMDGIMESENPFRAMVKRIEYKGDEEE
tara:strand:+ start:1385 stop:2008 length:624 start_codon:yes stop_codon:yes gene_type:complete